jgi:hypothetical protein
VARPWSCSGGSLEWTIAIRFMAASVGLSASRSSQAQGCRDRYARNECPPSHVPLWPSAAACHSACRVLHNSKLGRLSRVKVGNARIEQKISAKNKAKMDRATLSCAALLSFVPPCSKMVVRLASVKLADLNSSDS